MVTDMGKELQSRSSSQISGLSATAMAVALVLLPTAQAEELSVRPYVSAKSFWSQQEIQQDDFNDDREGAYLSFETGLSAAYESKRLELSSFVSYESIFRHPDIVLPGEEQDTNYLNIDAQARFNLVEDTVDLVMSGRHYQQILNKQESGSFIDKTIDSGSFVDAFDVQALLEVRNPTPTKFQAVLNALINARKTDNDESLELTNSQNLLDTRTQAVQFAFAEGTQNKWLKWNLQYVTQKTLRETGGTLITDDINGEVVIPLYDKLGVVVSGSDSDFQVDGNVSLSNQLEFSQIGAGLNWQLGQESSLSVIGYRATRGDDEEESYVGGHFDWRVSARTKLEYEHSANARGETDSLRLIQNNRYLKTRISASQGISINSRQGFSASGDNSLVCPLYVTDVLACYQPSSANYEPQVGERLVNLNQREFELTEEIVDQTLGNITVSYDNQNKLRASVSYQYTKQEGLESQTQDLIRKSLSTNLVYDLGRKTKLSLTLRAVKSDYLVEDFDDLDNIANFTISNQLTRKLVLNTTFTYRDRDAQRSDLSGTDKRVGLSIKYIGD